MIEFKRVGDVMVFECPAFKIEVAGNGAEHIELNREAINSQSDSLERISDAFKILDMMIGHKAKYKAKHDGNKKVTEMNIKANVDTEDAEEAIERINLKLNHETAEQAEKRLFGKGI